MSEFTHNIEDATHFQEYNCGIVFLKWREGRFWYWNNAYECYEPVCNFEINNIRSVSDLNMINKLRGALERALEDCNDGGYYPMCNVEQRMKEWLDE